MRLKVILGFLLAILLVIFAIQNAEIVNVKFLAWQIEVSRALLIVISMTTGALAYSLIALTGSLRRKRKERAAEDSKAAENSEEDQNK